MIASRALRVLVSAPAAAAHRAENRACRTVVSERRRLAQVRAGNCIHLAPALICILRSFFRPTLLGQRHSASGRGGCAKLANQSAAGRRQRRLACRKKRNSSLSQELSSRVGTRPNRVCPAAGGRPKQTEATATRRRPNGGAEWIVFGGACQANPKCPIRLMASFARRDGRLVVAVAVAVAVATPTQANFNKTRNCSRAQAARGAPIRPVARAPTR